MELGINYEQAQKLVSKYITVDITRLHSIETEAIMRALAKHFNENEDEWGIIGLLHDIDWDLTKEEVKNHTIKAVEILKQAGATDFLVESVVSHAYGNKECGEYPDRQRATKLQHSLVAAETLTGLIIASALVQPDKKLASVKSTSLKKKFKQKAFAANCDRELIREIEQTGLGLNEFLDMALKAIMNIAKDIGL